MSPFSTIAGGRFCNTGLLRWLALLVVLLSLAPLLVVCGQVLQTDWAEFQQQLWRPLMGTLALNTLLIVLATTICSGLVGLLTAWFSERTKLPLPSLWPVLGVAPMAIPTFVSSYAWVSISDSFVGFPGALLVLTSAYAPLVFLPVSAALRALDPALEESARTLGLGPWQTFLRVILPQVRPALVGGLLLVALSTLSEFGAFALLRFRTFTTAIFAEYRASFDGNGAAQLSIVLLLLASLLIAAEWRLRPKASFERQASGARRAPDKADLGRWQWPVTIGFLILTGVTLAIPLGTTFYWLTQHAVEATSPVESSLELIVQTTLSSIELGFEGSVLTVLMALPIGYLLARSPGRWAGSMERLLFLVQGVPGIVIALGLVTLSLRIVPFLYQTQLMLLLAYAILFLPLAVVSVRAAMLQAEFRMEELARSLGLSGWQTWLRVLVPLIAPGLGAAACLVFLSIVSELTATLLLSPIGTETLATQIWADTSAMAFASAAPYALVLTLLCMATTWLLMNLLGRSGVKLARRGANFPRNGETQYV